MDGGWRLARCASGAAFSFHSCLQTRHLENDRCPTPCAFMERFVALKHCHDARLGCGWAKSRHACGHRSGRTTSLSAILPTWPRWGRLRPYRHVILWLCSRRTLLTSVESVIGAYHGASSKACNFYRLVHSANCLNVLESAASWCQAHNDGFSSQDHFLRPGSCKDVNERPQVEAALAAVMQVLDCGRIQATTSLHGELQASLCQMAFSRVAEIVERWHLSALPTALQQRSAAPAEQWPFHDADNVACVSVDVLQISVAGLACCG